MSKWFKNTYALQQSYFICIYVIDSNTLATWCEELTRLKRPWCWETLLTEDEMVGWHHWLNGHESEQAPGDGEGQETWHAAVHGVAKSQHDWATEQDN